MTTPTRPSAIGGSLVVVRSALRLLWRHWPVLIALALAGFVARQGILMLSVEASELSSSLALLVFALVPVSMLVPMLLMMRVVRRSLPESTPLKLPGDRDAFLAHIASVLVPFLAVYAAYDYFKEDGQSFLYEIWFDETINNPDLFTNPSSVDTAARIPGTFNLSLAIVIGSAIGGRILLGIAARNRPGNLAIGFSRGYLEATWLSVTAISFHKIFIPTEEWFFSRQLWAWVDTAVAHFASLFGPLGPATRAVADWLGQILTSVDAVLIVPFAWLTIGCVIYGHDLISPKRSGTEDAVLQRWQRLPAPVRGLMVPLRNGADERFGPMVRGFAMLKQAGLRPLLLFCLAFVVAQSVPEWLWEIQRWIIGPQDLNAVWVPVSGPLSSFNESIGLILTICLVTAAVDYVLRVPGNAEPAPTPPAPPHSPVADAEPEVAGELAYPAYLYGDGLDALGGNEKDRRSVLT